MDLQPGIYRWENAGSRKYMSASMQRPGVIDVLPSHPDDRTVKWKVEERGGLYTLQNLATGEYASVPQTTEGTKLEGSSSPFEWRLVPERNQLWALHIPVPAGVAKLIIQEDSDGNATCTPARENDDPPRQTRWRFQRAEWGSLFNPELPGSSQHWTSIQYPSGPSDLQSFSDDQKRVYCGPLARGIYVIHNVHTGTVMDLWGGWTREGTKITGWGSHNGNNQKWYLHLGSTGYQIQNVVGQTFLSYGDHLRMKQGTDLHGHQAPVEWEIRRSPQGYQIHCPADDKLVVDLSAGSANNGTPVTLWPHHGSANQQWRFTRVM